MTDDTIISANDEGLSEEEMLTLLATLKREHARINSEVDALHENGVMDMLKLKRMKKIKLSIKDQITYLENMLTPDILA
jgi:hypothetical protein